MVPRRLDPPSTMCRVDPRRRIHAARSVGWSRRFSDPRSTMCRTAPERLDPHCTQCRMDPKRLDPCSTMCRRSENLRIHPARWIRGFRRGWASVARCRTAGGGAGVGWRSPGERWRSPGGGGGKGREIVGATLARAVLQPFAAAEMGVGPHRRCGSYREDGSRRLSDEDDGIVRRVSSFSARGRRSRRWCGWGRETTAGWFPFSEVGFVPEGGDLPRQPQRVGGGAGVGPHQQGGWAGRFVSVASRSDATPQRARDYTTRP